MADAPFKGGRDGAVHLGSGRSNSSLPPCCHLSGTRHTQINFTAAINTAHPMRTLIALLVLASTSFTGCAVYTPSGSVVIDPAGRHDSAGGKFCPPGQAKKGNC